jgi:hypothetical protein
LFRERYGEPRHETNDDGAYSIGSIVIEAKKLPAGL